jgi:hypothetical protein
MKVIDRGPGWELWGYMPDDIDDWRDPPDLITRTTKGYWLLEWWS